MEATAVYWKPVWHQLEGHFELVLAHAAQVKNVTGCKTDVNHATWLADLLAHGLGMRRELVPVLPGFARCQGLWPLPRLQWLSLALRGRNA